MNKLIFADSAGPAFQRIYNNSHFALAALLPASLVSPQVWATAGVLAGFCVLRGAGMHGAGLCWLCVANMNEGAPSHVAACSRHAGLAGDGRCRPRARVQLRLLLC